MKGLILYSSKTGNTKKMAESIWQKLKEKYSLDIFPINEIPDEKNYAFILLGSWIDRGTLEKNAMKAFKEIENKKIGLFATLGAMPDSDHGKKVTKNLEELLKNKDSLGTYLCPGLVDPKMIKKLQGLTGMIVPKKIKEKMIETSLKSRKATEEELKDAGEYFYQKIEKLEASLKN